MERNFRQMLESKWAQRKFVCVGLDSDIEKISLISSIEGALPYQIWTFGCEIVEKTYDLVCAFKPNIAFYEAHGKDGLLALQNIIKFIHKTAPDVPIILDAKRADIGNTNKGYLQMAFDYLNVDAITVNPFLGGEALEPFLARKNKGIFVLCRTSNPGSDELQDLKVNVPTDEGSFLMSIFTKGTTSNVTEGYSTKMFIHLAYRVKKEWNKNNNCGLVVGATYPNELKEVRKIVGDGFPILIPGIGAQGGDLEKTVEAGKDTLDQGMIINSSRGIIFASSGEDFAEAARRKTEQLHQQILSALAGKG